ncbi:molybdopterin molybdotransferase MoeA [Isoptericola cucumis]|uniref:Molybdopterin molybdenumtransferase n=1 Tax=Isoptericola cucumis TaxID=1776856 RepID=A0ABQ2B6D2_9MICO|nr:gephyrin-like molybdotransferase Glp [Isoptericola cucumis]GGI08970.1 molybdopterin molybdenumtransferase [Isoptericola cucumis]
MSPGRQQARTVEEHAAAVLARVAPLPADDVALAALAVAEPGRVLGADVRAVAHVPPFDGAAMDGYAVRLADLPPGGATVTLPVVGDARPGSPAGDRQEGEGAGGAVRIMTGAPVPAWADSVVPVERTSTERFVAGAPTTEGEVTLARQQRTHVRHRGEDVRPGDLLARAGDEVTPALVAVAASAGLGSLPVRRRPRVAVLSTGSELVPAGDDPGAGRIPDSNSLLLAGLVRAAGADVERVGAVPDDADGLRRALDLAVGAPAGDAAGRADLVVTTGGVSAGASDVVRAVLAAPDARLRDVELAAVALRPGRPQALARWQGVPWVALPGSPVSAFVSFALFVRPALAVLASRAPARPVRRRVASAWPSPPGRVHVVPVRTLPSGEVERAVSPAGAGLRAGGPRPAVGGHAASALLGADALALVPADAEKVEAGDEVDVLPLGGAT